MRASAPTTRDGGRFVKRPYESTKEECRNMSTAANHRKRSHRSQRRAGYAAATRKRMAASGQAGGRGFRMLRGIFHSRPREKTSRIATGAERHRNVTKKGGDEA